MFFCFEIAGKIFVKTFFFGQHLRLRSWSLALASGPQAFLSLASNFFLCPWPWPRALCP